MVNALGCLLCNTEASKLMQRCCFGLGNSPSVSLETWHRELWRPVYAGVCYLSWTICNVALCIQSVLFLFFFSTYHIYRCWKRMFFQACMTQMEPCQDIFTCDLFEVTMCFQQDTWTQKCGLFFLSTIQNVMVPHFNLHAFCLCNTSVNSPWAINSSTSLLHNASSLPKRHRPAFI